MTWIELMNAMARNLRPICLFWDKIYFIELPAGFTSMFQTIFIFDPVKYLFVIKTLYRQFFSFLTNFKTSFQTSLFLISERWFLFFYFHWIKINFLFDLCAFSGLIRVILFKIRFLKDVLLGLKMRFSWQGVNPIKEI